MFRNNENVENKSENKFHDPEVLKYELFFTSE